MNKDKMETWRKAWDKYAPIRKDVTSTMEAAFLIDGFEDGYLHGYQARDAESSWTPIADIEKYFDLSKYGEHESIEMVGIWDGYSEDWEHGRLQLMCDYNNEEKLLPAFGINHAYAETVFATDYKFFKRLSLPSLPKQEAKV